MISALPSSTSFWLLESRDSTWLIFSGLSRRRSRISANDGGEDMVRAHRRQRELGDNGSKTLRRTPLRSHSTDDAGADAGQADAGSGRDRRNNTGHGFITLSLPSFGDGLP